MPWAINSDLPSHVRGALPEAAQTRFRQAANAELSKGVEARQATRHAWSIVKHGWEKGEDGTWVRKSASNIEGELHIPRYLRGRKKKDLQKAEKRTLYVRRDVVNGEEIVSWAKKQGFNTTMTADQLHTTITYSKVPVDWMKMGDNWQGDENSQVTVKPGGPRLVEPLGDGGAVVLLFVCDVLSWRHDAMVREGASWDHNGFQPHITISWDAGDVDLKAIEPYQGKIVLGPEIFEELDPDWKASVTEKGLSTVFAKFAHKPSPPPIDVRIVKVDANLGLVFGFAIICKKAGEDYYDLNIDKGSGERVPEHITEAAMLEAAIDFAENSRVATDMHIDGSGEGSVPFIFPLTTDIAKALGISTETTGLMIAMKPSKAVLQKYISGEYRGFSIGGSRIKSEETST